MTHILDLAEQLPKDKIIPEILFFTEGPSIEECNKRKIKTHKILKKGLGLIFLFRIYKFIKENRYDIVHTHTINGNFFGRLAGKFDSVPVLLTTVHSHVLDELKGLKEPSFRDFLRFRIDLLLSCLSKKLVAVSETIRDRLINYGIQQDKIIVVENCVDTNKFRPNHEVGLNVRKEFDIDQDAKVIGIIGRMVPLKNHDLFLRAAKEVEKEREDVKFLIVGDGPMFNHIKDRAQSIGLTDHIIFTGWRNDIERIMSALDILVLCSQIEGHNIVILEAMSCEKPVVGTNVRGINSIIKNGENGILVPLDDPTSLARAMLYLISNPYKRNVIGNAGRKYVERKYSIDRMVSAYTNLYQDLKTS